MARFLVRVKGLNVLLVVFSMFVLVGSAYYMSTNQSTSFKSSASSVLQTLTGKLVKNGTLDASGCKSAAPYGLLGTGTSACVPLQAGSSQAGSLVDKKVMVTGSLQNGVFYASSIKVR